MRYLKLNQTFNLDLKCKYYGTIFCNTTFKNGKKFPFNDNKGLVNVGKEIINYVKKQKQSKKK